MSAHRLTEHNLFIHDQTIDINHDREQKQDDTQKQKQNKIPTWLTTLLSTERMHKLNAQLALNLSQPPSNTTDHTTNNNNPNAKGMNMNIDIDADIQHITNALSSLPPHDPLFSNFKVLEDTITTHVHDHHQENHNHNANPIPLERFLTPGSSDPYYIVERALEELGIPFGSLDSAEVRRAVARENADAVGRARKELGADSVCEERRLGRTI
ncbi:hypothetical protein AbraIFM66951_006835 [Aspergillus brasiliensis]|uniref:Uncharacterized protein n=1 Tax=Aspergillus brasiliensis TaxID=319629 RepID=A0A9W6DHW9_9EURO|nr:hypothetical protein AbraCBS73388_007200 [Aspergillus brasiliensis]GKZ44603.1 hypothetical protein AbraIFM66951_006835 [Aspergillus brasiliensis]